MQSSQNDGDIIFHNTITEEEIGCRWHFDHLPAVGDEISLYEIPDEINFVDLMIGTIIKRKWSIDADGGYSVFIYVKPDGKDDTE